MSASQRLSVPRIGVLSKPTACQAGPNQHMDNYPILLDVDSGAKEK